MSLRRLLLLPALLPVLAACTLPGSDAANIADCEDGFAEGMLSGPIEELDVENDNLEGRIHRVCEQLVAAGLDDSSSNADFLAVLRDHPALTSEMCDISTDALYADGFGLIVQAFGGYVTRAEAMRLGHDGCVYAFTEGYGSFETGLDMPGLIRAHPNLVAPFCRAPLMQAYDQDPPPQARRVYEEVVTEVCMEGIRTGVVDYSSGNFLNPSIDQKRFRALLDREWAERS